MNKYKTTTSFIINLIIVTSFAFETVAFTHVASGSILNTSHQTATRKIMEYQIEMRGGRNSGLLKLGSKGANSSDNDEEGLNGLNMPLPSSSAWILSLLFPLWLTYVSNQWSRYSLSYLVDFSDGATPFRAMNVDLNFSQSQYGLLASLAFTSLFAVASLGAGVLADRYNRKTLTISSAVGWSVAVLGTAMSTSYTQILSWRVAMGLACAFSTPTAYTLISERAPPERAALASSLYGSGVALGGAFAALSVLLDTNLGWRNTMLVISAFGLASAIIVVALLPDDPKGESNSAIEMENASTYEMPLDADENTSVAVSDQVIEVIATPRVQWLFLGSFLRFCSGLCIGTWSAVYYRMVFPDYQSDYAFAQAFITSVCGVSSGLIGGLAADYIASSTSDNSNENDSIGRKLWVPVIGSVLAAPAWYLSIHSTESFQAAMIWLAVEYIVAECWFGPTINVLQSTVGSKIGGTAQGMFTLTGAVGNLAPTLLGFLYGKAAGVEGQSALADLLSVGVCFGYLSSAACFAVSSQLDPKKSKKDEPFKI